MLDRIGGYQRDGREERTWVATLQTGENEAAFARKQVLDECVEAVVYVILLVYHPGHVLAHHRERRARENTRWEPQTWEG